MSAPRPIPSGDVGFTVLDLLFALAIVSTLATMAIPMTRDAVDGIRTVTAARYLASRLSDARMGAIQRSTSIGLRFEADGADYRFTSYADGNGNGIRTAEIAARIDAAIGLPETLAQKFPDVVMGLMNGYPDADGNMATGVDGVRIGSARIATMSPDGTATPGTLYLHGRRRQFAVRILGATGRVRVLEYRPAGDGWVAR